MSGKKGRSGRKPKPKPEELSLMPSASDPDIPLTTDDSESIVVTADGPVDPNVAVQFENEINLDRLLSGVAQGDGYYAKVYRKYPLPPEYAGRLILLQSFDLAGIDDLENHLLRMAKKYLVKENFHFALIGPYDKKDEKKYGELYKKKTF